MCMCVHAHMHEHTQVYVCMKCVYVHIYICVNTSAMLDVVPYKPLRPIATVVNVDSFSISVFMYPWIQCQYMASYPRDKCQAFLNTAE